MEPVHVDTGCAACHNGVNLGGQAYFPFGLVSGPGEQYSRPATARAASGHQYGIGQLRLSRRPSAQCALTAPYFHSGKVWDLEQAVAIMGTSQLGRELSSGEVGAITAFLDTLIGEQPRIELPLLPASMAETPRPEPMRKNSIGNDAAAGRASPVR